MANSRVTVQPRTIAMVHLSADSREAMMKMTADHADMVATLAVALAIKHDASLQHHLRTRSEQSGGHLARTFVWSNWTPTFPLLRERTVWLAACAARSAIAFGEAVVGKLFGLVAIALGHPAAADRITSEVRSFRRTLAEREVEHREYFQLACEDAIRTIAEAGLTGQSANVEARGLQWHPDSREGLAKRPAIRLDPATLSRPGRFFGFSMLPTVVATTPEGYYATTIARRRRLDVSGRQIGDIVRRAWLPSAQKATSRLLH